MVDPQNITSFHRSDEEIEEFAVFCVLVAGKNANTIAKRLEDLKHYLLIFNIMSSGRVLNGIYNYVRLHSVAELAILLRHTGIGCYTTKAATLYTLSELVNLYPNFLRVCSVEDLESIYGIGAKTSRFFLLHSRPNQRLAVLDRHVLTYLNSCNLDIYVPKSTPPKGSKKYKELENIFIEKAQSQGMTAAEFDLALWNMYSKNGNNYSNKSN